jgi:hypothetical protein
MALSSEGGGAEPHAANDVCGTVTLAPLGVHPDRAAWNELDTGATGRKLSTTVLAHSIG